MAATSILCIVLPAFRKMDLPASAVVVVASCTAKSRPVFQRGVWNLLRDCLQRCGDSDGAAGSDAGGRGTSLLSSGARGGEGSSSGNNADGGDLRYGDAECDAAAMDQLLRRRAAHALRLLIEYERELVLREGTRNNNKGRGGKKNKKQQKN